MPANMRQEQVDPQKIYASISANRIEKGLICYDDCLIFTRGKCIVIAQEPLTEIAGHEADINNIALATDLPPGPHTYLISSSLDSSVKIWQVVKDPHDARLSAKVIHDLQLSSKELVTSVALSAHEGTLISHVTLIDGSVSLFVDGKETCSYKRNYICFGAKMLATGLPDKSHLIFLASSANKIHVSCISKRAIDSFELETVLELVGHNDWVKCIDLKSVSDASDGKRYLLASASQDSLIRVWNVVLHPTSSDYACKGPSSKTSSLGTYSLDNDKNEHKLSTSLETVLHGHEGAVYGVCWVNQAPDNYVRLLSCSADKTIRMWQSKSSEVWTEIFKIGETGETNLPFLGIAISGDAKNIYANTLKGAMHSWTNAGDNSDWQPRQLVTGHHDAVTDLCWERTGAYLLSTSLDKTCRMHAQIVGRDSWHEICRPQVHGHEINCVASVDFLRFVTGSEEKILRVFGSTQFFLKTFEALASSKNQQLDEALSDLDEYPKHAQLPALGLSNKAALCPYEMDEPKKDKEGPSNSWYIVSELVKKLSLLDYLEAPPPEEILLQSTLWWETGKLFGHANELYALASDSKGHYLASASKANRLDLAAIIIWDSLEFRKVCTIEHHSLTITRLKFSPDDRYLLSVSRDRTWCLSERTDDPKQVYKKCADDSKHARIIWDCCWTPDSKYFMTVSRDKTAILWFVDNQRSNSQVQVVESIPFDRPINAVDCANLDIRPDEERYLFAFGLEDGSLELRMKSRSDWCKLKCFDNYHQKTIRRLAFRPAQSMTAAKSGGDEDEQAKKVPVLASGGDDCIVKLLKLNHLI